MIKACIALENGLLKSCRISGHAGAGPKGADIVCAAVSVLAGTALKMLSERKGITAKGDCPERGEFGLEITDVNPENREFLAAAGMFLCEGLLLVSKEFPDFCKVSIDCLYV